MASKEEKIGTKKDIRRTIGERGEELAASFLLKKGFVILDRNWRCLSGEIDIIAKKDEMVHIVEVKTRRISHDGYPEESISDAKLSRLNTLAQKYLAQQNLPDVFQIDAVLIDVEKGGRATLHYVPNFGW